MQFDFFATDTDLMAVWRLIYDVPQMQIFESGSKPDRANRWLNGWDEFLVHRNEPKGFLSAWPRSVGGQPRAQWVEFEPNAARELRGRGWTILETPALIDVLRMGDQLGCLGNSCIKCWDEKGARQRSFFSEEFCDEVDWPQFRSIVAKIQRQIRKICPAKLRHVPIMPDAFEKFQNGQIKLWNWGQECEYPSELVSIR